jgi:hypothetical protein
MGESPLDLFGAAQVAPVKLTLIPDIDETGVNDADAEGMGAMFHQISTNLPTRPFYRSWTPRGWLVVCGSAVTYVDDPNHSWLKPPKPKPGPRPIDMRPPVQYLDQVQPRGHYVNR